VHKGHYQKDIAGIGSG